MRALRPAGPGDGLQTRRSAHVFEPEDRFVLAGRDLRKATENGGKQQGGAYGHSVANSALAVSSKLLHAAFAVFFFAWRICAAAASRDALCALSTMTKPWS